MKSLFKYICSLKSNPFAATIAHQTGRALQRTGRALGRSQSEKPGPREEQQFGRTDEKMKRPSAVTKWACHGCPAWLLSEESRAIMRQAGAERSRGEAEFGAAR